MCVLTPELKRWRNRPAKSKKVKKKTPKIRRFLFFLFGRLRPLPAPATAARKKKRSVIREMRNPAAYRITMGRDKFFFPTVVLIGFSAYRFSELIGRFIFKDIYFFLVQLGFTRFYWVLRNFTGLPWVLMGFTWFYWVLLGFTGFYKVSLGFAGFYWVLLNISGFYMVLLAFTVFRYQ